MDRRDASRAFSGPAAGALVLLALWLGVTGARSAEDLLRSGDAAAAVPRLRATETERPRDPTVKRNLGIALLRSGDATAAVTKLEEARRLAPRDRVALFFLGRAAEQAGRRDLAIRTYGAWLARGGRDEAVVRARLRELALAEYQVAIRKAIAAEATLRTDTIPTSTIAVPEFAVAVDSDTLRPLARGLAVVLSTDLSRVPGLRVVERERLHVLTEELALAERDRLRPGAARVAGVDPGTAPRIGRLLGAGRIAQGGMVPIAAADVQLDAVVFELSSPKPRPAGEPVSGAVRDALLLEKQLLFRVLATLGIDPGPALKRELARPPTRSFDAFLEFSRGIVLEEGGHPAEALETYRGALRLDRSFAMARERVDLLSVTAADHAALDSKMLALVTLPPERVDRLRAGSAEIGLRGGPEANDPAVAAVGKGATVRTVVSGKLPP